MKLMTDHPGGISITSQNGLRIAGGKAYIRYAVDGSRIRQVEIPLDGGDACQSSISDLHGNGQQMRFTHRTDGLELTYRLNLYQDQPFILFHLSVRNLGRQAIYLHDLILLQANPASGGQVFLGEPLGGLRFSKVGWHGWGYAGLRRAVDRDVRSRFDVIVRPSYTNPTTPIPRRKGEFWSEGWGILASPQAALVAGFVSMADQFGQVYANCRQGETAIKLVARADGIQLQPGEECDSEWGYLQFVELPCADPAADYVQAVARQMQPRQLKQPPPPQWTHWYHFFHDISEQRFLDNLATIASLRDIVPYQVVQLDDGYQSAWGDWLTCNEKFPNGLEHLAQRIRLSGFAPGLWISPFVVQPDAQLARQHPDWLLKDRRGVPVNAGYFYSFWGHTLDASHPAVLEHLHRLSETLVRCWGFAMLKLDFMYATALPGARFDPRCTRAQALRQGLQAVRQGAGDEAFLLGCGCPFGPAIGIVDAMRIGPDTAPSWQPYLNWLSWATPLLRQERSVASLRNNLRHTLNLSTLHRRWWWNDPDCQMLRSHETTLNEEEVRSSVSLAGLSGGMVISSDDLTRLPSERLSLLSLLLPILSQGGQPLDLLEQDMPELYHLQVHGAGGQAWHLVGLFNWQDRPAEKSLSLERLGVAAGQTVYVFDFWDQRCWATRERTLFFPDMPAHGCKLLRICAMEVESRIDTYHSSPPLLVGDTLHVTQGAELAEWRIVKGKSAPDTWQLRLQTLDLGRKAQGGLWLRLPGVPHWGTCNGERLSLDDQGDDIYRVSLAFTRQALVEIRG